MISEVVSRILIIACVLSLPACVVPSDQSEVSRETSEGEDGLAGVGPDGGQSSSEESSEVDGGPDGASVESLPPFQTVIVGEEARTLPYASTPLERVRAAARILIDEGDPLAWGRDGQLTQQELSNPFLSTGLEGLEAFNVLDSNGYEGDYKCNLLAFELAYRAGLRVPLMGRGRGWGYPGPAVVVDQVEQGRMLDQWASRVEPTDLHHVQALIELGAALMIVGRGRNGTPGHVGMVDRVYAVEHAPDGRIASVDYSGWEANPQGARYRRRSWLPGRFEAIYLIELVDPPPGGDQVVTMGFGPLRASLEDAVRYTPESRTLGRGHEDALPIRGRGLPDLPVAHELLGRSSTFGPVVNVRRIARSQ